MIPSTDKMVVMTTTDSEELSLSIAERLIEEGEAACVNIIQKIRSIYIWKGEVCDDTEALLIIKTRQDRLHNVIAIIEQLHDYDCPEIIAMPIIGGSARYMNWLDSCLD